MIYPTTNQTPAPQPVYVSSDPPQYWWCSTCGKNHQIVVPKILKP